MNLHEQFYHKWPFMLMLTIQALRKHIEMNKRVQLSKSQSAVLYYDEQVCHMEKKLFWWPVSISVLTLACRTYLTNEFSILTLDALCN